MSDRDQAALAEYNRLAIISSLVALGLLVVGYYCAATATWVDPVSKDLVLSLISNLAAVLVVLGVSYAFLGTIMRLQRRSELDEWKSEVEAGLRRVIDETGTSPEPLGDGHPPPVQRGTSDAVDDQRRKIIGHILHATSLALVYPRSQTQFQFRTFCHLPDLSSQTLRPACMWSIHHSDDYNAAIPYTGPDSRPFVIAQAFNDRTMVRRNLPADHLLHYPAALRGKILPDLKGVLAVPICDYEPDGHGPALGTISIDSTETLETLGFDDDKVKDVLVWCAKAVHQVLTMESVPARRAA